MSQDLPSKSAPGRVFAALCVLSIAILGAYYYRTAAARHTASPVAPVPANPPPSTPVPEPVASDPAPPGSPSGAESAPASAAPTTATPAPRRLFFRSTDVDHGYGLLAYLDFPKLSGSPKLSNLSCEVVHYSAGTGICLAALRGVFTRYDAIIFGPDFVPRFTIQLNGIPSRTKLSRDGNMAAVTVFLTGHAYDSVDFTTETLLIDTRTGKTLANLEQFRVYRDGQHIDAKDVNYWGVTFTPDAKRFYCTLSTNRKHLLVRGEVASRTGEALRENVECPSLSPDAKRVVYKKRLPGPRATWRLHVLDLASNVETPLPETRSVDDQLEWLDDGRVLYSLPESQTTPSPGTDVWMVEVDRATPPVRYLQKAYSPAVVR